MHYYVVGMPCFECHRLKDDYEVRLHERADFLDEFLAAIAAGDGGKVSELRSALMRAEGLRIGAREKLMAHEAIHPQQRLA